MEGYVNKEVCVNIELFLLVFVHEKSPRRAFAAREWMSYSWVPNKRPGTRIYFPKNASLYGPYLALYVY